MPDKKTIVATTDEPVPLLIDADTLQQKGLVSWNDKIACVMGITHPKKLPDGTMVSICSNKGLHNTVNVYKIDPKTPMTREIVGSFNTEHLLYGHSFGLTENYAIVLEQPIMFKMEGMMMGKPMIQDMVLEKDKTTKIHVMKLSDGTVETFDTDSWIVSLHAANSYE